MSLNDLPSAPVPLWMKVLIVLFCLPVLALPWLISKAPEDGGLGLWLWLYPLYVLLSAVCEWRSYPRRPEVTWLLIFVMCLTHAAMWMLVLNNA